VPCYLDHGETCALSVETEYAQDPEHRRFLRGMDEAAVQWLRRCSRNGIRPDPPLWELDVISGGLLVLFGLRRGRREQIANALGRQLDGRTTGGPEQIAVMNEGRELVDPLT
jgi:hypothetical protein